LVVGMAFDQAGGLWAATWPKGIVYVPSDTAQRSGDGRAHAFTSKDGLSSDAACCALVDREGNVWIATTTGLDQFRLARVFAEPFFSADTSEKMIARSNDGSIYVASKRGVVLMPAGGLPRRVVSGPWVICPARTSGIWAVSPKGHVIRIVDDVAIEASTVPVRDEESAICREDGAGRLWVRLYSMRLLWKDGGGWHEGVDPKTAGELKDHWDLTNTPDGAIGFRRDESGLVLRRGRQQSFVDLRRTKIAPFTMATEGLRDIFVGGEEGLVRVRGSSIRTLPTSRFRWLARPRSLLQTPQGLTWLMKADDLTSVATAELDRAFDEPRAPLARRTYDRQDGMQGGTQGWGVAGPQAAVGGDGRVWFLTATDVMFADPSDRDRRSAPASVAIRSISANGTRYRDPISPVFQPGTRSLDITFAGLSLAIPNRVRFRYRLEGVDDAWVDPGTRRVASYSNLGPGRYRFTVLVANDEGVWNRRGTTLEFIIKPTVFQSWPFLLLCGAALLALIWFAYSLRLKAVIRQTRTRVMERMEEREHIARELHDTLLQSVQMLTLRFQMAVDRLPEDEPARWRLEQSINRADEVIADGRDRLRDLQPLDGDGDGDLTSIVSDIVARQEFDPATTIEIETVGTPRRLDPLILSEAKRIASEAIFNIWRHANASRVEIEVRYGASLNLRFADDGQGIDTFVLGQGGKPGHFGLPGMRERARRLRGDLTVQARAGGGTEVGLSIPGNVAYGPARTGWFARFRRKGR
jgi:signal transduction histidine kinase